jgi:short-chain fatty acids transporter
LLALLLTDKNFLELIDMWGQGLWGILSFAMQMTLILVTGHALASSKPVHSILKAIARLPQGPVNNAIKGAGGIALQFPLYGGIQGIMVSSGLAAVIAQGFISLSTAKSLPVWTFLAGGLINLFVPSGGGQWIVQGPINIPAAIEIGADPARVAMGVAFGDAWTNMIQPFWALPLLAIARLDIRDIMGYCTMTLLYTGIVIALGLYFL